jgi:hypothetical protein
VKSGAGCLRDSLQIRRTQIGAILWTELGECREWMNDRTNNKTKIIFSSMDPSIPLDSFSSYLMSFWSLQYDVEITIGNGAERFESNF